jgi:hypothetical protein
MRHAPANKGNHKHENGAGWLSAISAIGYFTIDLVPVAGLEPARVVKALGILSPLRLPFRHTGHGHALREAPLIRRIVDPRKNAAA